MSTINREDAIEAIKEKAMRPGIQRNADTVNGLLGAMNIIYDLPTAEKVGKWIKQSPMVDTEECSECGYNILEEEFETPFCPWCGAKMVRGEEALLPHLDLWCNVNGTYCTSDWFCADGKKRGKEDERTD